LASPPDRFAARGPDPNPSFDNSGLDLFASFSIKGKGRRNHFIPKIKKSCRYRQKSLSLPQITFE